LKVKVNLTEHGQVGPLAGTGGRHAQTGRECARNTAARPPAPTVAPNSPMSFHAVSTASPAVRVRRRCARITARTGPKLEIAA
jgi:hypothetical protein